jgi:histidyl-tRNA synthetase
VLVNGTSGAAQTGAITLTLPQDIATTSSPTFNNLTLGGDLAVNGGDITTSAASFNLLNATATTINFGGAASTLNIGPGGATATSVNIAGGSGATGCTVDGATGNLTCAGSGTFNGAAGVIFSNGLWNQSQPVKLWYLGPMFRHDRPQAGRYRQFNQVGFETIGVKDPAIDAELILVAFNFYKDLGIPVEMRVNSIGTVEERNRYKSELVNYYRTKRSYLCEDCRQRLTKNPLRLLDCKEEQCQPVKEEAPQIIDWLTEESKNYFMKVLEYLDEVGVPYVLAPFLVRGLDYYTHTVFEIFATEGENAGAQSALGAGGRYDLLVEELGGKPAAAAGFALGLERIVSVLKQQGPNQSALFAEKKPHVFFAQLGEEAKRRGLKIINELKGSGLRIAYNFFKTSLKTQLEAANSQGVAYVLILGQKEVQDKTIIIRDMESGVQEIVDQKKVESALKKKLSLV